MKAKETNARIIIDKMLLEAEWKLPGHSKDNEINVETEVVNEFGEADYVLLSSKDDYLCTVEAKNHSKSPLTGKEQARNYANVLKCRFVILSNGISHYFWDLKQGNPFLIEKFPTQEELEIRMETFNPPRLEDEKDGINEDYLALTQFPKYRESPDYKDEKKRDEFIRKNNLRFLRYYQLNAIKAIQNKIKNGSDRFLLEMATGTGKTTTSSAIIKMFLRLYKVRKILFLVDRLELETQAKREINDILQNDFETVIWKENKDDWKRANIIISTVQSFTKHNKYKRLFKTNSFDLVISDEAHRSLGQTSRNVFEYFIGFKIGLTATPRDFLKSVDTDNMSMTNPKELERRLMLDTYSIFGCEDGEPTFRYTLADGVKDGYLINPTVVNVETGLSADMMSKEGLVFKGVDVEGNDVEEQSFFKKDYEKKFKSNETNISFCTAFIKNALRDPFTNEIGKTLIFCVSQKHAEKITIILNELAEKYFPKKYQSNFAMQVTSNITSPDPQQMTVQFTDKNNNLGGNSPENEYYKTSKARVCVTVGMMTTGYDCKDLLNICLFRPVFSPTEFIQMKGRGTRLFDFKECWKDKTQIPKTINSIKSSFKLFDYFKNYKYFEEEFNYDEVLKLPSVGDGTGDGGKIKTKVDEIFNLHIDPVQRTEEINIPQVGMRIDRDLYKSFKDDIRKDKQSYQTLYEMVEKQNFDEAEKYLKEKYFNKSYSLDKLRESLGLDVNISVKELLLYLFGFTTKIKNKNEILEEEFDKLDNKFKPDENSFYATKQVFEAYLTDKDFRRIIDEKKFAELNVHPSGKYFKTLPDNLRDKIPVYIKENINLERFIDA
jgi:type I restriction enzyme R subunit